MIISTYIQAKAALLLYPVELFGTAVAAVSGALSARRKSLDIFGIAVVAGVTSFGGGTIRDLLLGHRPAWMGRPESLLLVVVMAFLTILYTSFRALPKSTLLVADAFALAFFTLSGIKTALVTGATPVTAVILGTVTGVAGGAMRDVLCAEIPLIFRGEIYALASLGGGSLYMVLHAVGARDGVSLGIAIAAIFSLRVSAIAWKLKLPSITDALSPVQNPSSDDERAA
jgi:uncharacterized membrane protein YeiH